MPKRHSHAKKSSTKKSTKKEVSNKHSKRAQPRPTKRGGKSSQKNERGRSSPKQQPKFNEKGAKIYSRRTPEQLRGNKDTRKRAKKTGSTSIHKSGTKTHRQSKADSRKAMEREFTEFLIKQTGLYPETKKLDAKVFVKHDHEGKPIPEKKLKGNRNVFHINIERGNFEKTVNNIESGNLDFLDKGLERNKPIKGKGAKQPRAVFIRLTTTYKGKKYFSGQISEPSFIVNKTNIKKLILKRLEEYQNDWQERADENEEYLEESGKAFAPKNISGISIEFIY